MKESVIEQLTSPAGQSLKNWVLMPQDREVRGDVLIGGGSGPMIMAFEFKKCNIFERDSFEHL